MLTAAAADTLAAKRSLVAPLLDAPRTRGRLAEPRRSAARPGSLPRGTPPRLAPRVRRLASVSATSLCSPRPGRTDGDPPLRRGGASPFLGRPRRGARVVGHRPGASPSGEPRGRTGLRGGGPSGGRGAGGGRGRRGHGALRSVGGRGTPAGLRPRGAVEDRRRGP